VEFTQTKERAAGKMLVNLTRLGPARIKTSAKGFRFMRIPGNSLVSM